MYKLRLSKNAQKDLDRLQGNIWQRVREALAELSDNPRPQGYKKLRGGTDTYRIRSGDYRVIYDIDDSPQTITVLRVKHRREVYREL